MAAPTRLQIEADFNKPKFKVEILPHTGVWTEVINARVSNISGAVDSASNSDNGVSFGSPSNPSADVEAEDHIVASEYLSAPYWINKPLRISFGFDTSDYVYVFSGPITQIQKKNNSITYSVAGNLEYMKDIKLLTPLYYRKPIATKTTVASVEDTGSLSWNAGLINMAFWAAGGRPYEQKDITYTEASSGWKFWYSCDQSIIIPDYTWYSGENTFDEVFAMARAAGGQIYQDNNGVVRYTQPLSFGDITGYSSYFTFDDSMFVDYSENISKFENVGTLKLAYTPRRIEPIQNVIEDTNPYLFMPNETRTIELSPQLPIWQYYGLVSNDTITATNTMKAINVHNVAVTPSIGAVVADASKVSIEVSNPSSTIPMIIHSIIIQGRPLAALEDSYTSFGFGEPERNIENNVYIQNQAHADRIIRMIYDFYVDIKPIITLEGVQYDPDRFVGELVKLDSIYNSSTTDIYRIIKIGHSSIGTRMDVDLVKVTGLPQTSDMFIIGTSYSGATVKQLSY